MFEDDENTEIHEDVGDFMPGSPFMPTGPYIRKGRIPPKKKKATAPGVMLMPDIDAAATTMVDDMVGDDINKGNVSGGHGKRKKKQEDAGMIVGVDINIAPEVNTNAEKAETPKKGKPARRQSVKGAKAPAGGGRARGASISKLKAASTAATAASKIAQQTSSKPPSASASPATDNVPVPSAPQPPSGPAPTSSRRTSQRASLTGAQDAATAAGTATAQAEDQPSLAATRRRPGRGISFKGTAPAAADSHSAAQAVPQQPPPDLPGVVYDHTTDVGQSLSRLNSFGGFVTLTEDGGDSESPSKEASPPSARNRGSSVARTRARGNSVRSRGASFRKAAQRVTSFRVPQKSTAVPEPAAAKASGPGVGDGGIGEGLVGTSLLPAVTEPAGAAQPPPSRTHRSVRGMSFRSNNAPQLPNVGKASTPTAGGAQQATTAQTPNRRRVKPKTNTSSPGNAVCIPGMTT